MSIRRTLYLMSGTLRGAFFIVIVVCLLGIIIYTQQLVADLRKDTRDIVEFYATTIQRVASEQLPPEALGWFFENVTQRTNFPLILTDPDGNPSSWEGLGIPETDKSPEALEQIHKFMQRMKKENEPVAISYDDQVISYLYYGDSKLITQLVYLPYMTIIGFGLLVLVAFLGFDSIKRSEQRFIWVGMAKETAHQLGTPISSLMGWLEIMKGGNLSPELLSEITHDISIDVKRLEKVAARFSQIGSNAELKKQDIHIIISDVVHYFHRRLPQSGKEIKLITYFGDLPNVPINKDLFEWAVENLIKNAIDAMKGKNGKIEITTGRTPDTHQPFIDFKDNGSGIHVKARRDIFKAGYSTKKRGWGLGLNLSKRIVEDFHKGRLYIKETQIGKGTTMRILLKK